ncbi:peptide MFS transporter [Legionella yabuuchiae]|uniref:peptide MFS transporter n=1 Tax=Legionella yabuuchiae TaxID=376727 RepID=UPI00241544E8|nr:peptide MFS transporter [Legionella yabuuchiae]
MQNGLSNHPPSLKIFFATEMWERYGFYVVHTLLVLYLVMHFEWGDHRTYPLIGAFTALTYLSPVIGGWIADRLLGQKLSIIIGAVVLFCSYLMMTYWTNIIGLFYSLSGIAVGTGLLKPNISSLLGNEYHDDSPRRERGFTIFYLGITTGIILGTTLPSYIQSEKGWPAAFFSAAVGMIFAIIIFSYGIKHYAIKDYSPSKHTLKKVFSALVIIVALYFGSFYILRHSALAKILFTCIALFSVAYLLITIMQETGQQARQTMVIGLLCLISMMFWSFYFQMFSSIMVFLKRITQPSLFGLPFPPPYYVAVQSVGMIVLGLFLGKNSQQITIHKRTIQTGNKFVLAMVCMTVAYLFLIVACTLDKGFGLLTPLYFIPSFLMIALAELLLSPIGLAAMTLLSSNKRVSTMVGIFFVSLGMGGFLSGRIATIAAIPKEKLDLLTIAELKTEYAASFTHMLYLLIGATLISILLNFVIRSLMTQKQA